MSTLTYAAVLGAHSITVPDETQADLEVPILSGPQRQGDVGIFPTEEKFDRGEGQIVPAAGIPVIKGEATGNTHLLHAIGPVYWEPSSGRADDVALGLLHVPVGSIAYLVHTDEHGCNGIAPGTYRLHGKREQADIIRRVAD